MSGLKWTAGAQKLLICLNLFHKPVLGLWWTTMPRRKRKDAEDDDGAAGDCQPSTSKKPKLEKKTSSQPSTSKKPKLEKKASSREPIPGLKEMDFSSTAENATGNVWNMKFSSWNINGIRAWQEKEGQSYIEHEQPDIFCCQETKCTVDKLPEAVKVKGYHTYWSSAEKAGYAGTGLYSKVKPTNVTYGIGKKEHDEEGRVITAEYDTFYFVTAYVPNSGRGLPRLKYRTEKWDPDFRAYLKALDAKKPVVVCGDLNVARLEIDLANPKSNMKTAGFTKEEREQFDGLLDEGFIDSYRDLYPEKEGAYTYWSYFMNARKRNVGWRLDYFLISDRLKPALCDSVIRSKVLGSDHCPIVLLLHLEK